MHAAILKMPTLCIVLFGISRVTIQIEKPGVLDIQIMLHRYTYSSRVSTNYLEIE